MPTSSIFQPCGTNVPKIMPGRYRPPPVPVAVERALRALSLPVRPVGEGANRGRETGPGVAGARRGAGSGRAVLAGEGGLRLDGDLFRRCRRGGGLGDD